MTKTFPQSLTSNLVVRARVQASRHASDDQTEKNEELVGRVTRDDYESECHPREYTVRPYVQRFERFQNGARFYLITWKSSIVEY
jgi:hypothetical protein